MNQFTKDKIGIFLAISCIIHCFGFALLALLLPFISHFHFVEQVHVVFFILALLIAISAFSKAHLWKYHKSLLTIGFFAIFLLFLSTFFTENHHLQSVGTIFSCGFLIYFHSKNIKVSRQFCKHQHCQSKSTKTAQVHGERILGQ